MKIDIQTLKALSKSLLENDIVELNYEEEGTKLSMKRGQEIVQQVVQTAAPTAVVTQNTVAAPTAVATPKVDAVSTLPSVNSPMVGTFYSASSPGAVPFVKEGDSIVEGQVLCIVEAMKLMNEVKSDKSGKIAKILFKDGQAVKKGDKLFLVE